MFIEGKKFLKIKEAAQNGDEKAKAILMKQFKNDPEGFEEMMDDFFNPKTEEIEVIKEEPKRPEHHGHFTRKEKLEKFLSDNEIKEGDPDYEDAVKDFDNTITEMEDTDNEQLDDELSDIAIEEKPDVNEEIIGAIKGLIADELEALRGYFNAINLVLSSTDDREIRSVLEDISNDEKRHIEMLKSLIK